MQPLCNTLVIPKFPVLYNGAGYSLNLLICKALSNIIYLQAASPHRVSATCISSNAAKGKADGRLAIRIHRTLNHIALPAGL